MKFIPYKIYVWKTSPLIIVICVRVFYLFILAAYSLNFWKYSLCFDVASLLFGLLGASGYRDILAPVSTHIWWELTHLLHVSATNLSRHSYLHRFAELHMHSLVTFEHSFTTDGLYRFPCSKFMSCKQKRCSFILNFGSQHRLMTVPMAEWSKA